MRRWKTGSLATSIIGRYRAPVCLRHGFCNLLRGMDHSNHIHHGAVNPPQHADMPAGHSMGHAMTFHFGYMETILFDFWMPEGPAGMFLSCLIVLMMCFVMETTRWLRSYRNTQLSLLRTVAPEERLRLVPTLSGPKLLDAGLHAIQLSIAYVLMLIFMTFNLWLCLATVVGEVVFRLLYGVLFPYLDAGVDNTCG